MKRIFISTILACAVLFSFAQGSYEAFRFSQLDYMGTARYMGAGGAFSSIGGDFSALNTNPAGIGLFKRAEVTITPLTLSFFKDNTTYNGTFSHTQNAKYTMPQAGLVITTPISYSEWKAWQFGFGYNRIMDYNNTFRLQGQNNYSFMDAVLANTNGIHYGNLTGDAFLAWNTWMIDTLPGSNDQYFSPFSNRDIEQTAVVRQSGGIDEMSLTFGGNYSDKLYLGASIGIPILDYTEETTLTEEPADGGNYQGISSYTVRTRQTDKGVGINARIGVIYQPVKFLRLSAAIHTPTYYSKISDTYTRSMTSYWVGSGTESDEYVNAYRFSLSTPFRFNVGAGFIINKRAFVSAEYEFYDYSMATLYANDYSFDIENQEIKSLLKTTHNVRIGGEVSLTQKFMLRAGYNFKSSPYRNSSQSEAAATDAVAHYGSLGFGFRSQYIFFDLAYVLRYTNDNYSLFYSPLNNTTAQIKNTTHRIVATIGCKF